MTYYKQKKDTNNAGAAFMKNIDVNSITLIINFKYNLAYSEFIINTDHDPCYDVKIFDLHYFLQCELG